MDSFEECGCYHCAVLSLYNVKHGLVDCACDSAPPMMGDFNCRICPKSRFCDVALNPALYQE